MKISTGEVWLLPQREDGFLGDEDQGYNKRQYRAALQVKTVTTGPAASGHTQMHTECTPEDSRAGWGSGSVRS